MTINPDQPLALRSAHALLEDEATRVAAGIRGVKLLIPGGQYERRPASVVNLNELNPAFHGYARDLDQHVQRYGPTLAIVLSDALVVGQGSVITRNGVLLQESCRAILEQKRLPPGFRAVGQQLFLAPSGSITTQTQPCLLAKGPWWRNYGHWLLDSAALLALVADTLQEDGIRIVVGRQTEPRMRQRVAETLDMLAPRFPVLEHGDAETMLFSDLCYVTPVSVSPLFKLPHAIRGLRQKLLGPKPAAKSNRRIYIAREPGSSRRLVNEPDVQGLCEAHGFEILRPEELSLREQARVFSEAEIVVGVKGAALTNMLFADPGSTLVVLAPNNWAEPFFWDLVGQLGINYVEILGRVQDGVAEPPNSPFTADLKLLTAALEKFRPGPPQIETKTSAADTASATRRFPSLPEHPGLPYQECLRLIHRTREPRSYLEIGVLDGQTLALAECPAIGIDVRFQPQIRMPPMAPAILLFQMKSDDFFQRYDPSVLLERGIDFAFLDGMHLVENLLSDFMHVEACCDPGSIIVMHDCLPLDPYMAVRDEGDAASRRESSHPAWWTGDVWKILPILQRYRPDLSITAFNAPPTGLVLVENLNRNDQTLQKNFQTIIGEFRDLQREIETFYATVPNIPVLDTNCLTSVVENRR